MLTLIGGLLAQTGCMPSRFNSTTPVVPCLPSAAEPQKDELPADEAARACLAAARNLDKAGNDVAAIAEYERVLQSDPGNLQAMRRLAVLYDRQCQYAKADTYYRKLTQARPRDADVCNDWGYSYYLRNNWAEAEKHLRRALELQPAHPRALANLGMVLGQQGRYGDALASFRAANVSEAEAHCNLAFVYWSKGRLLDARRECQSAQQLDSTCANAQAILAQLDRPRSTEGRQVGRPAPDGYTRPGTVAGDADSLPIDASAVARSDPASPGAPGTLPADLMTAAGRPRPVYVSPNGTGWIPIAPQPTVPPPSSVTTGTAVFE
jgi:Flp pilus assembly protein TadD